MERLGVADRAVEVLSNYGDDEHPDWAVGSGYVLGDGHVLTACHVVHAANELLVRFRGRAERAASVCRLGDGRIAADEGLDLAILQISGDIQPFRQVGFARIDDNPESGELDIGGCWGIGFPQLIEKERSNLGKKVREAYKLTGYIPAGEGFVEKLPTLRVRDAPLGIPAGPLKGTPWEGISGTVVFSGGLVVGVVTEHLPAAGMNSLTIVPLNRIDELEYAATWWSLLGVDDPEHLPLLPPRQEPGERLFIAEPVPKGFIERPEECLGVLTAICGEPEHAVGITTALRGAGGFGKSALSAWICCQPAVTAAYPDGVLWITLGEDLDEIKLRDRLADSCRTLNDHFGHRAEPGGSSDGPVFAEPHTLARAMQLFAESLGERKLLLVLDDAWRASDLAPFLRGGPRCARLITTRFDEAVPDDAARVEINEMVPGQTRQVICAGLPETTTLAPLERFAGGWVLLARLINSRLRKEFDRQQRAGAGEAAVSSAAEIVTELLSTEGITALDSRNDADRNFAVDATLRVSVKALDRDAARLFEMLSVFPEDTDIPADIVARWWGRSTAATKGRLAGLSDDSLLQRYDPLAGTARFHDVIRRWLRERIGAGRLETLNAEFADAVAPDGGRLADLADDDGYLWRHAGWHLAQAGRADKLADSLRHIDYLARKTQRLGVAAVESDLTLVADQPGMAGLARRYRQVAGLVTRLGDPMQVAANLHARLGEFAAPSWTKPPAYLEPDPRWPLRDINPRQERAYEQRFAVSALAWMSDGRLASCALDGYARLWPADGGAPELVHHGGALAAVAGAIDGRLAIGSEDGRVSVLSAGDHRLADLDHGGRLAAVAWARDGRLATGGWDGNVRIWPAGLGAATTVGRGAPVRAVAWAPDGRLASGDDDGQIRIWLADGSSAMTLDHGSSVFSLAWAADGRLASGGAYDGRARTWAADGGALSVLNTGAPSSIVAWGPGGLLAVGAQSQDGKLQIWPASGEQPTVLNHGAPISALAWAPDGRLATGGPDGKVRIWPEGADTPEAADLYGSSRPVAWSPDGRLVSGGADGIVRIWPADGGAPAEVDHGAPVSAVAWALDGRLATGGEDGKNAGIVRIWPADGGPAIGVDHVSPVLALAWAPDGRLAIGGGYQGVRVWSADGGQAAEMGDDGQVRALAWSADGRLASGGMDGKVRVWFAGARTPIVLDCGGPIMALAWSADGTLAAGCRDAKTHLWPAGAGAATILRCAEAVFGVAWAGSRRLVSAGFGGRVQVWPVPGAGIGGGSPAAPTLPEAEFQLDRSCRYLAAREDAIACVVAGQLTVFTIGYG